MSERVDWLLPGIASELALGVVQMLGGGEFGAALVHDRDGRELVLKALPGERWAARFARGAELSALVRSAGYPVPRYVGTGLARGASWSLQERLPGHVPDVMTESHARQLLRFVQRHAGAADRTGDARARLRQELGDASERLEALPATRNLGRELAATLASGDHVALRTGDVVHADFHHRNFLAVGDRVTGVFDWELAYTGDWRIDLVNIACWGAWVPWQIPPPVNEMFISAAMTACEPAVLALFTAFHTTRALDFNVRVHPGRLPWLLETIDATTRTWLRVS